jgi:hypothetical protein
VERGLHPPVHHDYPLPPELLQLVGAQDPLLPGPPEAPEQEEGGEAPGERLARSTHGSHSLWSGPPQAPATGWALCVPWVHSAPGQAAVSSTVAEG